MHNYNKLITPKIDIRKFLLLKLGASHIVKQTHSYSVPDWVGCRQNHSNIFANLYLKD